MPRYVFLAHDWPVAHVDFLLEDGEHCLTWRLAEMITDHCKMSVEKLPNHRLLYLDYEGPVSGDRGTVSRIERGHYEWVIRTESTVRVRLMAESGIRTVEIDHDRLTSLFAAGDGQISG